MFRREEGREEGVRKGAEERLAMMGDGKEKKW